MSFHLVICDLLHMHRIEGKGMEVEGGSLAERGWDVMVLLIYGFEQHSTHEQ